MKLLLTCKERVMVQLAANGATNKEIGVKVSITEGSVKNMFRTIFDKCGVWTRSELALWYFAHRVDVDSVPESCTDCSIHPKL